MTDARIRVLFIEDDKVDQIAFERSVRDEGLPYDYVLAGSVSEANSILDSEKFDIVVTDYLLRDGTAFDIFGSIKDIPIVFVTGAGDQEIAVSAIKAGASDYLIKDQERSYLQLLPMTLENAINRRRVERQHRMLSHAVLSTKDSVCITDTKGKVIFVNKAFCETYGYNDEDILGKNVDVVFEEEPVNEDGLGTSAETRAHDYAAEYIHKRQDGTRFPVSLSSSVVEDENGNSVAVIQVSRDITERKRAEESLRRAKEEAEGANRLKTEFLANMSHEIRTPMNAIIGMTGIALDTNLTEEQREYLSIVKDSAYGLMGLLDDILDLSKIEAGRVELETIDFDLRVTVEGVADALAHKASEKRLELACTMHHSVPVLLRGDPGRLKQILLNLGSNAVKFTHEGEVVIRVDLQEESEGSVTLVFSVTDTGIGLPEHEREKVFESFVQGDGSITRAYGGTGLGLSISKRLVERLGGQIGVESEPGKGSRFWFYLTFEKQTESTDALPSVPSHIRGKRILVIDDNATNRRILVNMLESFGCSAASGKSGAEALDLLKKATREKKVFDLLLLDMHMPEMDGEQTLRAIKKEPEIKHVMVVILTSAGMPGDVARLQALGCIGYLLKPVKQSQLHDLIVTALTRQDTELGSRPARIITRHTLEEQKRRRVHILIVEDNPMNQEVAIAVLRRVGYLVDAVENGKMAVEALKGKSYDLIFMDIQLPEMDGLRATRIIREMEGSRKHTPVVALTAYAMKGDRERCLEAGLDDYISKPIEPQELLDATEKWTRLQDLKNEVTLENEPSGNGHTKDASREFDAAFT